MQIFKSIFLAAFLTVTAFSISAAEPEEIVVQLTTQKQLEPLYLANPISNDSGFSDDYLSTLQAVLRFDFTHNGTTHVIASSSHLEQIASSNDFETLDNSEEWQSRMIFYVLKTKIQHKMLSARAFSIHSNTIHSIDNIVLTGNLDYDRRQVHLLADTLHRRLFDVEGIASTKVLYTIKTRTSKDDSYQWMSEVWEADYDGGNARQITHENSFCVTPTYLPPLPGHNSGAFFYVSYRLGQPKIYIASLNDGIGRRLTFLRGNQLMPAISPQRDKVAFVSDVTSQADLFLQPFNNEVGALGKPQQIFSAQHATQATPTFNPDGNKIAFVSNKDGIPRIYIMDTPERRTQQKKPHVNLLTKRNSESTAPAWSPDGQKIAYCSKVNGIRQIWFVNLNTGEEKQLTDGPNHKENPTWAPNSVHLMYNTANEESSELYLMNLNNPKPVQITAGPGEKRFPCWEWQ